MLTHLLGDEIGSGGEGTVYALPDHEAYLAANHVRGGQLRGEGPYVAKVLRDSPDWDRIVRLIEWLGSQPENIQAEILTRTTWPLVLVTDPPSSEPATNAAASIVMRRLDEDYFTSITSMGRTARRLRVVDYLFWNTTQADAVEGFEFPDLRQRLHILMAIAEPLWLLHRAGLHFGDLNANNVALGSNWDAPSAVLVDCDSIRTGVPDEGDPLNAPGWMPPEGGVSPQTDCYKFALLCARTLGCSNNQVELKRALYFDRLGLDQELTATLLAGMDDDPANRPTLYDLGTALARSTARVAPGVLPRALPPPYRAAPPPEKRVAEPPAASTPAAPAAKPKSRWRPGSRRQSE